MAPDPNSVALMRAIDDMPPEWRALVHEFGFKITEAIRAEASDATDARAMLEYWRSGRQAEWLATNYITQRSFRIAA